jgi:hypothetical protein
MSPFPPPEHARLLVQPLEIPIKVNLEPEGNEIAVPMGDWLVISFPAPYDGVIEIAHGPDRIVVCRTAGDTPTVTRKDGTAVLW